MATIFTNALGTSRADSSASFRTVVPITAGALDQVRVTLRTPGTGGCQYTHVSIGIQSGAGTYITTATPVELKWGGSTGFADGNVAGDYPSDWVNLTGFSSSDKLVVIFDFTGTTVSTDQSSPAGCTMWYLFGSNNSYNLADPTSLGGWSSIGWVYGVTKIETQSTGGGTSYPIAADFVGVGGLVADASVSSPSVPLVAPLLFRSLVRPRIGRRPTITPASLPVAWDISAAFGGVGGLTANLTQVGAAPQIPPGPVLKPGSSLLTNLLACYLPGVYNGVPVSNVGPTLANGAGGSGTITSTVEGPSSTSNTLGSAKGLVAAAPSAFTSWTDFTIYWRGQVIGSGDQFCPVVGVSLNDNDVSPYYMLGIAAVGSPSTYSQVWAFFGDGATYKTTTAVDVSAQYGQIIDFAATATIGGNVTFYANGVSIGTLSIAALATTLSNPKITVNQGIDATSRATNASVNMACFWNRALSSTEIANLHTAPYSLLATGVSATFAGVGGLTADLTQVTGGATIPVAATFAGVGGLTSQVTQLLSASATFTGVGGLTSQVTQLLPVAATFAGVGGLTSQVTPSLPVAATFAGVGGLTSQVTPSLPVAAAFGGVGGLAADVVVIKPIVFKGAGGTSSSTTADQSTGSLTTGITAGAAGDIAVLTIANDNAATSGTGDIDNAVSGVVDDSGSGNVWLEAGEFCNSQSAAQAGATISIWYCVLRGAIPTGSVISWTLSSNTSRDAQAASLTYFSKDPATTVAVEGTNATLAVAAGLPGSITVTTSNVDCLRFRAIATESNSPTGLVKTAAFANTITQSVANSGSALTSMAVRAEYLISAGTGVASNPTGGAGVADHASLYTALKQVLIVQASAAFAGVGGLTADLTLVAGIPGFSISATFAGVGGLTSQVAQTIPITAAFAGVGGLTPQVAQATPITAAFAGVGGFAANVRVFNTLTAFFSGATGLTASLTSPYSISAVLAGTGSLDNTKLRVSAPITAAFAGVGGLTADLLLATQIPASATFNGVGGLTAQLTQTMPISATFAGVGGALPIAMLIMPITATFSGLGGMAAATSIIISDTATFNGVGGLTAQLTQTMPISATFNGTGFMSGSTYKLIGDTSFNGAGGLTAQFIQTMSFAATFAGAGGLTAQSSQWMRVSALFAGVGGLAANVTPPGPQTYQIAATFAGVGSLTAPLLMRHVIRSTVAGVAGMSADLFTLQTAATSFTGVGGLAAAVSQQLRTAATLNGVGGLAASLTIPYSISASFNGVGSLAANVTIAVQTYQIAATFAGVGGLAANALNTTPLTAVFAGVGGLTVDTIQRMSISAKFAGTGFMAASTYKLIGNVDFNGVGKLTAQIKQTMVTSAAFAGVSGLAANVSRGPSFYPISATFAGDSGLSAQLRQRMQVSAAFAGDSSLSAFFAGPFSIAAAFGGVGGLFADVGLLHTYGDTEVCNVPFENRAVRPEMEYRERIVPAEDRSMEVLGEETRMDSPVRERI